MNALLFRKLVINGVNYYQLFRNNKNFIPDDNYASFTDRSTKDFFYIDMDSDIEISDPSLLNIYYDDNGKLSSLSDPKLFEEVFNVFKEKFNIVIREIKPVSEIVNNIDKKILFQRETIEDLVNRLYLNQRIMASNLPVELKLIQKDNILFHGPIGSGKKSIIECLEKELNIPYADVTISSNLKDTLEDIINQLLSRSNNDVEASCGIVFFRDNFINLTDVLGDNVYKAPSFFIENEQIKYDGHKIDFRTLSFVVLLDDRYDMPLDENDLEAIMAMTDCTYRLKTKTLSDDEKCQVLYSKYGRINLYKKCLNESGYDFIIDEHSLKKIISECSKVDVGMNCLNATIDQIVKKKSLFHDGNLCIDDTNIMPFISNNELLNIEENKKEIINDLSSRDLDTPYDEEVDRLAKIITRDVVGQDKQVRSIIYTIIGNRRSIKKYGLDKCKNYIENILIRGESGSGKTMIIEKITELLNIPTFIADSTQYTETGWHGDSISDMFLYLYHKANGNLEEAQKGILFIDEIDKKASTGSHDGPSRGAVLDNLLKSIEGSSVAINVGTRGMEEKILFDTRGITVICSGAFIGLEECRDRRLGVKKAGFERVAKNEIDTDFTVDDYIEYGMSKEFMSRFIKTVELNKTTKKSLIDVMKKSESSQLKIEKSKLEDRGIELEYTEDFYDGLAEVALRKKIGVRGISQSLIKVLDNINVESIKASEVSKIILNKDVIYHPENVVLVYRTKQKKLSIK